MATVRLEGVTTGYPGKTITENITATLKRGCLTSLLGPNGAGKSTLLKTLCGFIPAIKGEIEIDGKNLRKFSASELAKTLGVVLTERPTAMNMTVEELVGLGRTPYTSFFGSLKKEDVCQVEKALRQVDIYNLKDRKVNTLSDGERQKVMIAKALAQQTRIIYLDEPTAFLDFPSKVEIMKLLYRIAKEENKTIFLSSHDVELALQLSDDIWLLDRKNGLRIGSPESLAADGSMALYFERPGLEFNPETLNFRINQKL